MSGPTKQQRRADERAQALRQNLQKRKAQRVGRPVVDSKTAPDDKNKITDNGPATDGHK